MAEVEYTRFGEGWVTRTDPASAWESIDEAMVPGWRKAEERARLERRRLGYDPDGPLQPGSKRGTRILDNPKVDALAAELGLTAAQLRGRLNGDTGGSRTRVSEARFDEIAAEVGLSPEEIRERFRN